MDDTNAFESQVGREVVLAMGPLRPVDDAAIFTAITATTSVKWRFWSMFSATRFVVAGVIVALFGGLLLVAQPFERVAEPVPGAETDGLPPVTGPAGNGLVAFSNDGDIYVGDPVTGESEVIVAGPEMDTSPKFSPDGTRIAFVRLDAAADPQDHEDADVVVVNADGSDERTLKLTVPDTPIPFGRNPWDFVWSPDGGSLVVVQPVGAGGPKVALSLVDATGVAEARALTPTGASYGFGGDQVAWFLRPPSGDRVLSGWQSDPILVARDLDGSDVIDLGEVAGLEEARLRWAGGKTYPRYTGLRGDAAWSPDASRIAFQVSFNNSAYTEHLYVMDADASDLRLLTDDGGGLAWSPDGSTIATQQWNRVEPGSTDWCERDGYTDFCASSEWITLIDVETGAERDLEASRLPNPALVDAALDEPAIGSWSWSPDGRSILMMPGEPGTRPLVIDVETDTSTELPWESDSGPSWQRVAAD